MGSVKVAFLLLAGGYFLGQIPQSGTYTVSGQEGHSFWQEGSISQSGTKTDEININTADASLLQTLSGIGAVRAQAIVDDRRENGAYSDIEDLLRVPEIGQSTLNDIKNYITVG